MKSVRAILAILVLLGAASLATAAGSTASQIAPPAAAAGEGPSCKLQSASLPIPLADAGLLPAGDPTAPQPALACGCFCCNPFNYCRINFGPQYYCETSSCQCEHV